jgi:hypothetical protein
LVEARPGVPVGDGRVALALARAHHRGFKDCGQILRNVAAAIQIICGLLYPRSLAAYGSLARLFNSANARPASLPSLVAEEASSSA